MKQNAGFERDARLRQRERYAPGAEQGTDAAVKSALAAEVKSINEEERSIVYVITSSAIDRYGEIVDPHGLDLSNFRKSKRTVFWNHDYDRVAGRSLWEKQEGEQWLAKVQFAADATAFAQDLWNLARRGYIGMTSIGFLPRAHETVRLADLSDLHPSNRADFDPNTELWIWRRAELLEFSLVGVAANPEASEVLRMASDGELRCSELRNELALTLQERRLCELESCRAGMAAIPDRLERLEREVEHLRAAGMPASARAEPAPPMTEEQLRKLMHDTAAGTVAALRGRIATPGR